MATTEAEMEPDTENEEIPSLKFNPEGRDITASVAKTVVKAKQGRKAKQQD